MEWRGLEFGTEGIHDLRHDGLSAASDHKLIKKSTEPIELVAQTPNRNIVSQISKKSSSQLKQVAQIPNRTQTNRNTGV